MNPYFQANQALWDAKTDVHAASDFYQMDAFKKGATSLKTIELTELGDVKGKSMLHLQCHFGQDSISWARQGASVTGIDLSPKSIALATELANVEQADARFICANVYDTRKHVAEQFDIVFTSYGTIIWLPDLDKWAKVVADSLNTGGIFYMADFHPTMMMFDDDLEIGYKYFPHEEPYKEVEEGTYADTTAHIAKTEYFWSHSLSETINALLKQGLTLELFNEYDYSPYDCLPGMKEVSEGKWVLGNFKERLPHVYSMRFRK